MQASGIGTYHVRSDHRPPRHQYSEPIGSSSGVAGSNAYSKVSGSGGMGGLRNTSTNKRLSAVVGGNSGL